MKFCKFISSAISHIITNKLAQMFTDRLLKLSNSAPIHPSIAQDDFSKKLNFGKKKNYRNSNESFFIVIDQTKWMIHPANPI